MFIRIALALALALPALALALPTLSSPSPASVRAAAPHDITAWAVRLAACAGDVPCLVSAAAVPVEGAHSIVRQGLVARGSGIGTDSSIQARAASVQIGVAPKDDEQAPQARAIPEDNVYYCQCANSCKYWFQNGGMPTRKTCAA